MKLLLFILLLASCTKTNVQKNAEICNTQGNLLNRPAKQINHRVKRGGACILLDFNGQQVNSPHWNGGVPFYCEPALVDTQLVLNQIRYAFEPFNVTITTNENLYLKASKNRRIRIIITPTSSWRQTVSGVAFNGSFNWGDNTPAFVFSDRLDNNEHHIGEIAVHEAGHTLGLTHQSLYDSCQLIDAYRPGAYMGNSLYVNNGEWITGTTWSCNAYQNDIQILNTKLP